MLSEFFSAIRYAEFWKNQTRPFVYENIALQKRYERCGEVWEPHLQQMKMEIIRFLLSLREVQSLNSIMILGTGLLYEVPLAFFQARPEIELIFVDQFFPASVVNWAKKHGKTKLVSWNLEQSIPPLKTDSVISCNVLSQLPLFSAKNSDLSSLTKMHWKQLRQFPSALLLSDFQKQFCHQKGIILECADSIDATQLPSPKNTWIWNLAPLGEIASNYSLQLKMGSWWWTTPL